LRDKSRVTNLVKQEIAIGIRLTKPTFDRFK